MATVRWIAVRGCLLKKYFARVKKSMRHYLEIGKKLKNARVQSGMTQENVAEKINVSRQTISNWENEGKVDLLNSIQ